MKLKCKIREKYIYIFIYILILHHKLQWLKRGRDLLVDLRLNIKIKLTADKGSY